MFNRMSVSEKKISIREQLKAVNYDTSKFLESLTLSHYDFSPEELFQILNDSVDSLKSAAINIEEEVVGCQRELKVLELELCNDIDSQSEKLAVIQKDVEAILKHFEEASSGAVRLGDRLNVCELERKKLQFAEELLSYIRYFEKTSPDAISNIEKCSTEELLSYLPQDLRKKNWGEISHVLFNMRRILYEINSEEVCNAETNIRNLSEAVELELLGQFEDAISHVIEDAAQAPHVRRAQSLAEWLHLFNNGSTLQKRFIFSVVERRIPVAKFFRHPAAPSEVTTPEKKTTLFGGSKTQQSGQQPRTDNSISLVDHLSELFVAISDLCQEQFSIIRQVFPNRSVEKVTKMLITRIFNDPAFGIQARVDSILRPKPPAMQLSLPEYLDALVTVREKLSALHLMLLEYCTAEHDYADIDAEMEATSNAINMNTNFNNNSSKAVLSSSYVTSSQKKIEEQLERELLEKRQKTEELQSFLEDQVAQVFQVYLLDYFEKEIMLLKHNLKKNVVQAAFDSKVLTKVAEGSLPKIRHEKVSSIQQLLQIVNRNQFIQTILYQGADTIDRMVNIGRDDEKKLPMFIKDVFLTECMFITDSIFIPWAKAVKVLVEKHSSSRQQVNLIPPPPDFLISLSTLNSSVKKFRVHFDDVFSKPLSVQPNALTVCQESRRQSLKAIDKCMKEAVHSWITAIVVHYKKVLEANTKKQDFCPRHDSDRAGLDPTVACKKVCEHLTETIRDIKESLTGINTSEVFWKPLARQFVAVLISHIKRHKVSDEGSFVLVRDMDEYHKVFLTMDCGDSVDLISCLREMMYIYMTPAENVVKMVSEDLRHLDTQVVLVLAKSRTDYSSKAEYDSPLNEIFASFRGNIVLPWELNNPTITGPVSLRKVAVSHKEGMGVKSQSQSTPVKNKMNLHKERMPTTHTKSTVAWQSETFASTRSRSTERTDSSHSRRAAPKSAAKIMSPSTASAKSTMFNKMSSVFKFKS